MAVEHDYQKSMKGGYRRLQMMPVRGHHMEHRSATAFINVPQFPVAKHHMLSGDYPRRTERFIPVLASFFTKATAGLISGRPSWPRHEVQEPGSSTPTTSVEVVLIVGSLLHAWRECLWFQNMPMSCTQVGASSQVVSIKRALSSQLLADT